MKIDTTAATAANTASRRAQLARLDTGSDWYGAENLRAMLVRRCGMISV